MLESMDESISRVNHWQQYTRANEMAMLKGERESIALLLALTQLNVFRFI